MFNSKKNHLKRCCQERLQSISTLRASSTIRFLFRTTDAFVISFSHFHCILAESIIDRTMPRSILENIIKVESRLTPFRLLNSHINDTASCFFPAVSHWKDPIIRAPVSTFSTAESLKCFSSRGIQAERNRRLIWITGRVSSQTANMQERLLVFLLTTLQLASRAAADGEFYFCASLWLEHSHLFNSSLLHQFQDRCFREALSHALCMVAYEYSKLRYTVAK